MKIREATESEKKARRKSKKTRVEEGKSSKLKDCRINSGKGGLSSFNGYYGLTCNG